MPELVIATNNRHKFDEIAAILVVPGLHLVPLSAFAGVPELVENGATYAENALIKARTIAGFTGKPALADDTGLEIDALAGAPGLYSARYAGEGVTFEQNRRKVLDRLAGVVPDRRTARFRSVLALVAPDGTSEIVEGVIEGVITESDRGSSGFGYDSIFYVPAAGRTLGEMTAEAKNRISHRARALDKMRRIVSGCSAAW